MKDIDLTFRAVCAQSNKPPYARILDTEKTGYSSAGKTFKWWFVERSRKRRYNPEDEKIELHYTQRKQDYIAVSCPWQLPASDNIVTGKYRIDSTFKIQIPQDVVLDRVIKFAAVAEQNQYPFWIDKLCINQDDDSDEKQIAIQSMDQVYKRSKLSLGLLFVRLDFKEQVEHLHALMSGQCAREESNYGDVQYTLTIDIEEARVVLKIADLIVRDNWWERAWIFQEEYLSQLRMRLLIRSSQYDGQSPPHFGKIPGELQVEAAKFRAQATILSLAFRRHKRASKRDKDLCTKILKKAGKYNILLTKNNSMNTWGVMSPKIFEEIGRRDILNHWDILPIACNSCDYSIRLDTRKLQEQQQKDTQSLSLAILTTYILNGEILRHGLPGGKSSDNVFEFLRQNTLDIDPPLEGEKGLTFTKHCRFPDVAISRHGIETRGIIWSLGKKICLPRSFLRQPAPRDVHEKIREHCTRKISSFNYSLEKHELETLWRLVYWLRKGEDKSYTALANSLNNFLKEIALEGYNDDWTCRHIMSIMATSVARAIQKGKQLCLGCIDRDEYSPYSAIFVRDRTDSYDDKCFVFTSWTSTEEIADGDLLATSYAKYTSLEIGVLKSHDHRPIIKPKRWINGLCFFSNADAKSVMIPWPESIID